VSAILRLIVQRAIPPGRAAGSARSLLSLALLLAAGDGPLAAALIGFDLVQRVWPRTPDGRPR